MATKIDWADEVWNPIAGCTKCSPGCLNCYAERMAWRLRNIGIYPYHQHPDLEPVTKRGWTGIITCNDKSLNKPLRWHKSRRIFVCSMSDLFHEKVPFEFITKVLRIIEQCPHHTFLILTKRPEIAFDFYGGTSGCGLSAPPLPNVQFILSISTQKEADEKIPILLQIPAAVRGLSIEPMLGGIDLQLDYGIQQDCTGEIESKQIHWVVVGGESGPGARPMHPDWPRNIRDQCVDAGVPFYFKQWGEWIDHSLTDIKPTKKNAKIVFLDGSTQPWSWLDYKEYEEAVKRGGRTVIRVGKKKAGCILDDKIWKQLPESTDGNKSMQKM